ncbi:MAG: hypothetical protein E7166_01705 [Firmicutes bacterium]|nr:hypothetical protein [Bacillota bacterium]
MKSKTIIQADEMLELLNKQWATIQDIMKIGALGRNKARNIKNEIERNIIDQGLKLPNNLVPMEKVIEYFKINLDFLVTINKSKNGEI